LEDTLVAQIRIHNLINLLLGGFRVDDQELPGNLLAVLLSIVLLLLQVLADLLLEVLVQRPELVHLEGARAVGGALRVLLQALDLVADGPVLDLRLRDQGLELLRCRAVAAGQRPLVQRRDLLHVGRERPDLAAYVGHPREEVLLRERVPAGCRGAAGCGCGLLAVGLHFVLFLVWRVLVRATDNAACFLGERICAHYPARPSLGVATLARKGRG